MLKSVDFPHEELSLNVVLESIPKPRAGDRRVFLDSTFEQVVVKIFNVLGHRLSFLSETLPLIKDGLMVRRGKIFRTELGFHVFPSIDRLLTPNSPKIFYIKPISFN